MAFDKAVDSVELDNFLKNIANKIRKKAEAPYDVNMFATKQDFYDAIDSIQKNVPAPTPTPTPTEIKEVTITQNGRTSVEPQKGKLLEKVIVNVNVPNTGGNSNVELIEFIPPATPSFKNKTGDLEIWGWGIKDAAQAWMSTYYTFHGKQYSNAIDDADHDMTLSVVDGRCYGIPEMSRGKCLAVLRIN